MDASLDGFNALGELCTLTMVLAIFVVWAALCLRMASRIAVKSHAMVRDWALRNDLVILSLDPAPRRAAPEFVRPFGQRVFRVAVKDRRDRERRGVIVCGGYWTGLATGRLRVYWDGPMSDWGGPMGDSAD